MVNARPLFYSAAFLVRLSPEQLEVVRRDAEKLDLSISSYARMCLGLEDCNGDSLVDLTAIEVPKSRSQRRKLDLRHGKAQKED